MEELNLPHNIKRTVDKLVECIRNVYSDQLVCVALYGSAARGEYAGKYSNINLAIVLNDTSISSIKKAACLLNKNKFSIINPVFFTEDYIKKSLDVFPIEFLDMKESHSVLYGKDIFKDLQIDIKNLRFQCEQELKSKILNIKKFCMRTSNKIILKNFLFKSATSSLHILRNLVRLKGKQPSCSKDGILDDVAREFAVDVGSLRSMLNAKNINARLGTKEIDQFFAQLVEILESISDKVDLL